MTGLSVIPVLSNTLDSKIEYSQTSCSEITETSDSAIIYEIKKTDAEITEFINSIATKQNESTDEVFRSVQNFSEEFYYYTDFQYKDITHTVRLNEELQRFLYNKCQAYGVEYELILAIIGCESGWDVNVTSDGQYYGLGMISAVALPQLSSELGITDLTDPKQNIEAICFLMAEKIALNENHIPSALMSYNKGQSGAEVYFEKGIYETGYTIKVLGFRDAMKERKQSDTAGIKDASEG